MKTFKTFTFYIIIFTSLLFLLNSCSSKQSPEDITLNYFNLYVKNEVIDNLPITKDEINNILRESKENELQKIENLYGDSLSNEDIEELNNKTLSVKQKIEDIKVEIISEENDKITLKLSYRPLDDKAYKQFIYEKDAEIDMSLPDNQLTLYKYLLDEIIDFPKFSDDMNSLNITLNNINGKLTIDSEIIEKLEKLSIFTNDIIQLFVSI